MISLNQAKIIQAGLIIFAISVLIGIIHYSNIQDAERTKNVENVTQNQINTNMTIIEKQKIIEFNCKAYVGISNNYVYDCMNKLSKVILKK